MTTPTMKSKTIMVVPRKQTDDYTICIAPPTECPRTAEATEEHILNTQLFQSGKTTRTIFTSNSLSLLVKLLTETILLYLLCVIIPSQRKYFVCTWSERGIIRILYATFAPQSFGAYNEIH